MKLGVCGDQRLGLIELERCNGLTASAKLYEACDSRLQVLTFMQVSSTEVSL